MARAQHSMQEYEVAQKSKMATRMTIWNDINNTVAWGYPSHPTDIL